MPKSTGEQGWDDVFSPDEVTSPVLEDPTLELSDKAERKFKEITYDAFTLTLLENVTPALLFGMDLGRKRFMLVASIADVFVGKEGQLANSLGFPVPAGVATEFFTTDEMYLAYRPLTPTGLRAYVGIYVERCE